jgi:hypothetical protein
MWYSFSNLNRHIPKISVGSLQRFYDLMCLIKDKKYFSLTIYVPSATIWFKIHLLEFLREHTFAWVTAFACVCVCVCVWERERVIYLSFFTLFLVTPIIDTKILQLVLSCISFQIVRIFDLLKNQFFTHTHLLNKILTPLKGEFIDIQTWKYRVIVYFHF